MTKPQCSLLCLALAVACGSPSQEEELDGGTDGGSRVEDLSVGADAGDAFVAPDLGAECAAPFRPMRAYDFGAASLGEDSIFARSIVDGTHGVSHGQAIHVRVNPGEELLPACSGGHFFGGRRDLPAPVPQGRTVWFRMYHYIPSTFSFGYKYGGSSDRDEASACGRSADGNLWLKWLVFAPDIGTARVYLMPTAARRALVNDNPRIRIISEALHRPGDFGVDLPRDRWFSLQMAVHVSSGDDGFIRAWLDDEYLGEVVGPTTVEGASLVEWGLGDYWNGVPWTDGEPGRSELWVDEIVVASDADGYEPPTGVDAEGHPFIPSCVRAADLRD